VPWPEYVKTVVEAYNQAIDALFEGKFTEELIDRLTTKLATVFNRGFWDGYYLGNAGRMEWGLWVESHKRKQFVGKCTNYSAN
jgi:putative protease